MELNRDLHTQTAQSHLTAMRRIDAQAILLWQSDATTSGLYFTSVRPKLLELLQTSEQHCLALEQADDEEIQNLLKQRLPPTSEVELTPQTPTSYTSPESVMERIDAQAILLWQSDAATSGLYFTSIRPKLLEWLQTSEQQCLALEQEGETGIQNLLKQRLALTRLTPLTPTSSTTSRTDERRPAPTSANATISQGNKAPASTENNNPIAAGCGAFVVVFIGAVIVLYLGCGLFHFMMELFSPYRGMITFHERFGPPIYFIAIGISVLAGISTAMFGVNATIAGFDAAAGVQAANTQQTPNTQTEQERGKPTDEGQ